MRMHRRHLRPLGGAVGIAVAVAGGLGAAVGVYSLPDPRHFAVGGNVYARADQRAIAEGGFAVDDDRFATFRIEAMRTASAGGRGFVSESSQSASSQRDVNTYLQVGFEVCNPDGSCEEERRFDGPIPLGAFRFNPALRSASLSVEVDGCRYEVEWRGTGAIVPFHDANTFTHMSHWFGQAHASGFATLARQAHASVETCFVSSPDAPGSLGVGLSRTLNDAFGGFGG